MIGTYASAALICAASLLVGRAILAFAGGDDGRHWLAPAVGFAAVLAVSGFLARAPGHATSATLGVIALIVAAGLLLWWQPRRSVDGSAGREGLAVAVLVGLVLSIPFVVSGRWGIIGVGFNNDLGLHLAWAEWLRSGFGPAPEAGYPLGPHALADAVAAFPGIGLGQAFVGEVFAIGILSALSALSALDDLAPARRVLAACLVPTSYLGASYFAQGAFKETGEALFVLAFALFLHDLERRRRMGASTPAFGSAAIGLTLATGIFFSYSFAGLAWPLLIFAVWALTVPGLRRALAPRSWLSTARQPAALLTIAVLGLLAVLTVVGPYAFIHGFNRVAGTNTYGPVSPIEALGVWPSSNYRLNAAGGAQLTGLAGAIGTVAILVGTVWWLRRREYALPIALGACTVLYLASLAGSGEYSQAKALMIAAPLATLIAIRPLLLESTRRRVRTYPRISRISANSAGGVVRVGWVVLAVAFVAGGAYSSLLVLRDAPVGPPGHGSELRAFMPILRGEPVLYAGQDRYAAYELMGADTHVPLVEFPDADVSPSPEKPFDTGDAYSPIDFDSFSHSTLQRFPYVITGHAAWNSEAPPGFKRVAATPSYVLWKRTGEVHQDRHVLLEGTEPAARVDCAAPELRILTSNQGRAGLFPDAVIGNKSRWTPSASLETGESATQVLRLRRGRWLLSMQYFSPFDLTLSAPGFERSLEAALDGQRPNTISLANEGQFWPAGEIHSNGRPIRFTVAAAEPSTLQRLSGYSGKANVGELVAVPARPHRIVPFGKACGGWLDWYESAEVP